jgi:hypothetical protein
MGWYLANLISNRFNISVIETVNQNLVVLLTLIKDSFNGVFDTSEELLVKCSKAVKACIANVIDTGGKSLTGMNDTGIAWFTNFTNTGEALKLS